jgi:pyruvate,orthophosphate dikinase
MGKPAVVGVSGLTVTEGTFITIDGTSGEIALGHANVILNGADAHRAKLLGWADDFSGDHTERGEAERLTAAHAALRQN